MNNSPFQVFSADFVLGATDLAHCPQDGRPHLAFFGRSNVGKSSLLAKLMGKRNLVRVSATPGKTREINFFLVNEAFYFADLPGIGYAKVSIKMRDKMATMIRSYVEKSPNLRGIVYLVDMRHAGTPLDIETVNILRDLGKPVLLVANKRDKLNQSEAAHALRNLKENFGLDRIPLTVSATRGTGINHLWASLLEAIALESA
ncbi:MAG TPA: ribosome biogenesis GTP-binding protein YihA/YsxC [Fibrobacteraceae bacterium]|nr:ribosome biogenesis GTP-binding protein YihA/YsxC [Fibrobacteraceae bacterium]